MEERLLGSEAKDIDDLKGRVWKESKKLWRVAFPAMLARVSQYGMFVITQGFIGHLGEVELAAYALIQIIAVRFSNGILVSFCDCIYYPYLPYFFPLLLLNSDAYGYNTIGIDKI